MDTVHTSSWLRSSASCTAVFLAFVSLASCLSQRPLEIGNKAGQFQLKTLAGTTVSFEPASGRVYLLYFWADWCARCEDDFRMMDDLHSRWMGQAENPRLLAINVGQSEEHIGNFVKKMKISFPISLDRNGKVARSYGVKGLPTYFLVDKEGVVRHIILGWADERHLLDEIRKIGRGP